MKKNSWFLMAFLCLSAMAYSQGFTNINAGLTGLHWGDVAWGDYDSDGDLDVIVTGLNDEGSGNTIIYKNNGADSFSELMGLNIPGTFVGDVAWGDYDADGDLDILIQGYTDGDDITKIYKNNGTGSFTDSGISFPNIVDGSTSFVDYNNDGFIDILLAGFDGESYLTILYKNNGNSTFSESGISLPGAIKSSYEWGDYDNDGDMDIFISGLDGAGILISKLYENNGDETFTETTNNFVGAWLGDMVWGDYDNDGDLDILLSGYTQSTERIAKVFKNNGDGSFDEVLSSGLVGVSHCSVIWGDYDNDGDLDVFIAGTYEGSGNWVRVTDVFINNGDDSFTAEGLNFAIDSFWGESAWGDYDNDGDLDLICSGFDDAGGSHTIIYRNESSTANTAPESPENLMVDISDNNVSLSWDAANDNETPSAGLNYNAYIRDEEGHIIWNSLSLIDDGFRLMPAIGNAQQNSGWLIKQLAVGNYFCSVQAIDHSFEGSAFSDEVAFTITYVGVEDVLALDQSANLSNYPNPFTHSTSLSFKVEETGFVQLDIFNINGQLVNSLVNQYKNNGQHTVIWNGESGSGHQLNSGVYYYILKVNGLLISQNRCLLLE